MKETAILMIADAVESAVRSLKTPTNDEIINFLNTSNQYLETSSLLKPILMVLADQISNHHLYLLQTM